MVNDPFIRDISILAAFTAGFLSFVSPCILPIIPSFMAYVTGSSIVAAEQGPLVEKSKMLLNAGLFILGFSLVFIALGATATTLGQALKAHQDIFRKVGGGVVVLMGVHMTGLIQLKPLLYEKRLHFKGRPVGYLGSLLIGIVFAAGWTPCIGLQLGTILTIAGGQDTVGSGILLLAIFSLGLAIPFFLTALLMDTLFVHFRKLQRHMRVINVTSGAFLVIVGVLIFTNSLQAVSNALQMIMLK